MDETTRTSGRHSTDNPYGTAYDVIRQHTGTVWVKPDHHRHAQPESFAGDLSDNRDMAVS